MGDVTIGVGKPGSRSLFGWAADYQGCGYYRISVPLIAMRERGWKVNASHLFEPNHFYYDAVLAQRTCAPGPSRLLHIAKECGMPVVIELDDDLFNINPDNGPAYNTYIVNRQYHDNLVQNLKMADALVVSTEPLKQAMSKYNKNIIVLPNYVDQRIFDVERVEKPTDKLTIGWAGSFTHAGDFALVKDAMKQVLEKHPNVLYHGIGWDYANEVMKLPADRHIFQEWLPNTPEYYRHLTFDIGIAPLANNRFNDCKTPLKAIEYGCFGIPVVASKFGPYARYVKHGETGFLAKKHSDWVKYLTALINDPEMRYEMGQNNRRLAGQQVMQNNVQPRIDFFEELISERQVPNHITGEKMEAMIQEVPLGVADA